MKDLDYRRFEDAGVGQRVLGRLGDGLAVLLYEGAHTGNYLIEWLTPLLAEVDVRTFADLRLPSDPNSSLEDYQRYSLVVHASDLTRRALVRLPWDYGQYGMDPDTQQVAAAVRASMSIPFFFRPVTMKTQRGKATWVDGGLLSNFPLTVFDRTDGRPERWPTWGVKLSSQPADTPDRPLRDSAGLAVACLRAVTCDDTNRYRYGEEGINRRTIYVDTSVTTALDFHLTRASQDQLFDNGRAAAADFLQRQKPIRRAGDNARGRTLVEPPFRSLGSGHEQGVIAFRACDPSPVQIASGSQYDTKF